MAKNNSPRYGPEHHGWKGDAVSYKSLHKYVREHYGSPTKCQQCGTPKKSPKGIQWANISKKYRREREDWIALCVPCHRKFDFRLDTKSRGEKHPVAKLTEKQVLEIRAEYAKGGISHIKLGKKYGLQSAQSIVTRLTWKHV